MKIKDLLYLDNQSYFENQSLRHLTNYERLEIVLKCKQY